MYINYVRHIVTSHPLVFIYPQMKIKVKHPDSVVKIKS